jgi:hypothetical protein
VHPPIVPPTMTPRSSFDDAGAGASVDVDVSVALVAAVTLTTGSLTTELVNKPQLRTAELVKPFVAQPCCVMVVRLYAMSHL